MLRTLIPRPAVTSGAGGRATPNTAVLLKTTPTARPTDLDRAYLAGIIDGEGWVGAHIQLRARQGRTERCIKVEIAIANTDRRLIDWAARFWPGNIYDHKATTTRKLCWYFKVWGDDMGVMLAASRPFLVLKREQADIAAELLATRRAAGQFRHSPEVWARRFALVSRLTELNKKGPAG